MISPSTGGTSYATSNPQGIVQNVNNNIDYSGFNGFAPGVSCATPFVQGSGYSAGQSVPGVPGVASGNYGNNGIDVSLIYPIGGASNKACRELSESIVRKSQYDTCIQLARLGYKVDPKKDPEEAARCNTLVFDPSVMPQYPNSGRPSPAQPNLTPPEPPVVVPVPSPGGPHTQVDVPVAKTVAAALPHTLPQSQTAVQSAAASIRPIFLSNFEPRHAKCVRASNARRLALLKALRKGSRDPNVASYVLELHAACVPNAVIVAAAAP